MQSLLFGLLDRWRSPPPPRQSGWLGTVAYAHRGLHGPGVPENAPVGVSPMRWRAAWGSNAMSSAPAMGRRWCSTTFGAGPADRETGPVARRSAAELGIELSGSGDHIPTLGEVLDEVAGRVPVLIEVKSARDRLRMWPRCAWRCGACWKAIAGRTRS
jgi:hypothetical protein